jgi:hypothetical protein
VANRVKELSHDFKSQASEPDDHPLVPAKSEEPHDSLRVLTSKRLVLHITGDKERQLEASGKACQRARPLARRQQRQWPTAEPLSVSGLTISRIQAAETLSLFTFAMTFRLRTPIPLDLIPILSNDPEKQRALVVQSLRDSRRIHSESPHLAVQQAEETARIAQETFSERLDGILNTLEERQWAYETRCMKRQGQNLSNRWKGTVKF